MRLKTSQKFGTEIDPVGKLGFVPAHLVPAGFDAIVELDLRLITDQLAGNLRRRKLLPLTSRIDVDEALFPEWLNNAIRQHIPSIPSFNKALKSVLLQARFDALRVRTLQAEVFDTPADTYSSSNTDTPDTSGLSVELTWRMSLDVVLVFEELVRPEVIGNRGTAATIFAFGIESADVSTGERAPPDRSKPIEERNTLATGRAVVRTGCTIEVRPSLLQFWSRLDFTNNAVNFEIEDSLLTDFITTDIGRRLFRSALENFLSQDDLRITPRFALGGHLSPARVMATGLSGIRVRQFVLAALDDREVLALCVEFPPFRGVPGAVRPFLGKKNLGYYVASSVLLPVARVRWDLFPARRDLAVDMPIELATSQEGAETQQGTARLRLSIGDELTIIEHVVAAPGEGDPILFVAETEVQLTRLWDPDGKEVTDLGDNGEAISEPVGLQAALFERDSGEFSGPAVDHLRALLRDVLKPAVMPFLENRSLKDVTGYSSATLQAIVTTSNVELITAPGAAVSASRFGLEAIL